MKRKIVLEKDLVVGNIYLDTRFRNAIRLKFIGSDSNVSQFDSVDEGFTGYVKSYNGYIEFTYTPKRRWYE